MIEYSELGRYILALCESQNLSLRRASIKAGLDASTISKILQRDGRGVPAPETLERIAGALGGDFLYMMGLAGHLPAYEHEPDQDELDAELYAKLQRLQDLVHEVARRDLPAARQLMGMIITPFEIMQHLETLRGTEEAVVEHGGDGKGMA